MPCGRTAVLTHACTQACSQHTPPDRNASDSIKIKSGMWVQGATQHTTTCLVPTSTWLHSTTTHTRTPTTADNTSSGTHSSLAQLRSAALLSEAVARNCFWGLAHSCQCTLSPHTYAQRWVRWVTTALPQPAAASPAAPQPSQATQLGLCRTTAAAAACCCPRCCCCPAALLSSCAAAACADAAAEACSYCVHGGVGAKPW
jgi:hypothetical protein